MDFGIASGFSIWLPGPLIHESVGTIIITNKDIELIGTQYTAKLILKSSNHKTRTYTFNLNLLKVGEKAKNIYNSIVLFQKSKMIPKKKDK